MAIRRTHGKVSSIGKLAYLAGKSVEARRSAERRQEAINRAFEAQQREMLAEQSRQAQFETNVAQINARKESQLMAMGWENEKLLMNSQRAYAKEIKKSDAYDLAKDKLNEHRAEGRLTQAEYNKALVTLDMRTYGGGDLPRQQAMSPIEEIMQQYMGMGKPSPEKIETQTGLDKFDSTPAPSGQMKVVDSAGRRFHLPIEEWEEAKTKGYKVYAQPVTKSKQAFGGTPTGMAALGGKFGGGGTGGEPIVDMSKRVGTIQDLVKWFKQPISRGQ